MPHAGGIVDEAGGGSGAVCGGGDGGVAPAARHGQEARPAHARALPRRRAAGPAGAAALRPCVVRIWLNPEIAYLCEAFTPMYATMPDL